MVAELVSVGLPYDKTTLNQGHAGDANGPWERYKRIKACKGRRNVTEFRGAGRHGGIALCGSGPSLATQLDEIRKLQRGGFKVAAVNTAHDYLWDNGIQVDAAGILDPRPWVKGYITPRKETTYFIASQVDPGVWDLFDGFDTVCWHNISAGDDNKGFKWLEGMTGVAEGEWVKGGNTVGLRMFMLCRPEWMSFARVAIFGFDSSFSGRDLHVRKKASSVVVDEYQSWTRLVDPRNGKPIERQYFSNKSMIEQAGLAEIDMIKQIVRAQLAGQYPAWFQFWFNGRGLLPDMMALYGFHKDAAAIRDELTREVPKVIAANDDPEPIEVNLGPPSAMSVEPDFFKEIA